MTCPHDELAGIIQTRYDIQDPRGSENVSCRLTVCDAM